MQSSTLLSMQLAQVRLCRGFKHLFAIRKGNATPLCTLDTMLFTHHNAISIPCSQFLIFTAFPLKSFTYFFSSSRICFDFHSPFRSRNILERKRKRHEKQKRRVTNTPNMHYTRSRIETCFAVYTLCLLRVLRPIRHLKGKNVSLLIGKPFFDDKHRPNRTGICMIIDIHNIPMRIIQLDPPFKAA